MAKLTEQDILNKDRPEDDHEWKPTQFFKELLLKLQDELIENASATTDHLQEHESAPDQAWSPQEEYALEFSTRDRERKLLNKVQASIHSIDEGEYATAKTQANPLA